MYESEKESTSKRHSNAQIRIRFRVINDVQEIFKQTIVTTICCCGCGASGTIVVCACCGVGVGVVVVCGTGCCGTTVMLLLLLFNDGSRLISCC